MVAFLMGKPRVTRVTPGCWMSLGTGKVSLSDIARVEEALPSTLITQGLDGLDSLPWRGNLNRGHTRSLRCLNPHIRVFEH
jgi:hypothetical protein